MKPTKSKLKPCPFCGVDLNGKCERDINKFPAHLRIRQVPWATKGVSK